MKRLGLIALGALAFGFTPIQNNKYAHGTVFGEKPNVSQVVEASKLESFLGRRTGITTAVKGKILKVKNPKGGWFDLDAGNGKIIAAHFKNYNVNLPAGLKGHTVIADGVVQHPLNSAAMQHFAGDKDKKATGAKQQPAKKDTLMLVVRGLIVQ
jgi:hypothetical protein